MRIATSIQHTRTLLLTLAVSVLAACASNVELETIGERMAERGYLIGPDDQRIPRYRISSWNSIDDRYLIVRSGVSDHYLVELFAPCLGLDTAFSIGFATPSTRLDSFGSILVRDSSRSLERCRIENIYLLADID
jgi:hypothetical protein